MNYDGHKFLINSLDTHTDGETFLSADDVSIFLWKLDATEYLRKFSMKCVFHNRM